KWRNFSVCPDGYLLEGRCFQSVSDLIKWFKKNAHKLAPPKQVKDCM
ncbi:unnamed protein product, partial [Choristocarpus tenellus]